MTSSKLGLQLGDHQLSGLAGILAAILYDEGVLERGAIVISVPEPATKHDGMVWYDVTNQVLKFWSATAVAWQLLDIGGVGGLAAHISSNPLNHANGSILAAHLADGAVTTVKHADLSVSTAKLIDAAVTAVKLAAGAGTDTVLGNRTINDTSVPGVDTGVLTTILGWFGNRLKALNGAPGATWRTAWPTTMQAAADHAAAAAPHSGHETPAGAQAKVDTHAALDGAHGIYQGDGSPEGVKVAPVGSWYRDRLTGNRWRKASGTLAVGWVLGETSVVIPQSITVISAPPFGVGDILQASDWKPSGSVPYPANNRAIGVPFYVPLPLTAKRMFVWLAAASGNIDLAIYDATYTRVVSKGSTVAAGTFMFLDIADTPLAAGQYFMVLNCSTTGCTFHAESRNHLAEAMRAAGCFQSAIGATSLPAGPLTPAAISDDFVPFMGVETGAVV